jgi:hypothetical protein
MGRLWVVASRRRKEEEVENSEMVGTNTRERSQAGKDEVNG